MRLSLKTKFTLATSLLVLAVVTVVSGLYLGRLTSQVLRQADDRARFVAQQVFLACQNALAEAAETGHGPRSSQEDDVLEYVRQTLDNSSPLNSLIESAVGYSATIYEITISDKNGNVLVSSDASQRGQKVPVRPRAATLVGASFIEQLRTLYGPPQTYEYSLPFTLGSGPFGDIRIGLSSTLMRDEISPGLRSAVYWAIGAVLLSTLLALLVSQITLAPLARISDQLDRISAGEFDLAPAVERTDELGLVSTKITGIGKQLHDVREIFSTVRENLDQVMRGLGDGLLLFNGEGRAVLVSPSIEKFLDVPPDELRGRRVSEIFPARHPLRGILRIEGDQIESVEGAEVSLGEGEAHRRIGVSAQVIREHGKRMGTLVTLHDTETLERIGNQLQVSERLAALGRVTAGVAHEVKNPLNSMRLWLEVLKGNMPTDPEPQQAVKMLDSEIDRLDRAVKTFLNFTNPVEMNLEQTELPGFLEEILETARPAISKAGIELVSDLPQNVPAVFLDRQLIHQAVLNLLLNASEFTPKGGRITLSLQREGDFAQISVSDTGKGIAPEDRNKIFQLFYTTRPGGSGIGLANTFRFVQLHNGRIEFDSALEAGTTFRVKLPLASVNEPAVPSFAKVRDFGQPFATEKR
jgi:signal transduction histidine kinase